MSWLTISKCVQPWDVIILLLKKGEIILFSPFLSHPSPEENSDIRYRKERFLFCEPYSKLWGLAQNESCDFVLS